MEKLAKRPVEDTDRGAFRWASVGRCPAEASGVDEDSSQLYLWAACPEIVMIANWKTWRGRPTRNHQHVGASRRGWRFFRFRSRQDAEAALTSLQNADVKLGGRSLTFDWGTSSANQKQRHHPDDARRTAGSV